MTSPRSLAAVIDALELKADRIAVELDGQIIRRAAWPETPVAAGARLEIVNFVGGGSGKGSGPRAWGPGLRGLVQKSSS